MLFDLKTRFSQLADLNDKLITWTWLFFRVNSFSFGRGQSIKLYRWLRHHYVWQSNVLDNTNRLAFMSNHMYNWSYPKSYSAATILYMYVDDGWYQRDDFTSDKRAIRKNFTSVVNADK